MSAKLLGFVYGKIAVTVFIATYDIFSVIQITIKSLC